MAKIERGGIRLIVENYEAFTRQLNIASASLNNFGQSAQRTASQVNAAAGEYRGSTVVVEEWTETIDTSAESAAAAAQSFTMLGLQLAALGAAGASAITYTGLFASRIEEVGALLEVTRKNAADMAATTGDFTRAAALSSDAVKEQVEGIRDLHLSGLVAIETVAALIRYGLDFTRAIELARLAQDAATFAMQDSSQAVEGLIHGITTLQPRVLRTYGIMVNLTEAYRVYAKENDLAAENLTQAQRQQAAFNAVLAQGTAITGAYEASMQTASKQLRSLNTDLMDLSEEFGEHFVPVLNVAVGGLRDILHWLTELDDPIQAFLVGTTSAGSALLFLGGTALLVVPRILTMIEVFKQFTLWAGVSSAAILAPAGIIAALAGIAFQKKQEEDAWRETAAEMVASSQYYDTYVDSLENADLAAYGLTEQLWELVKAQEASSQAAYAEALIRTKREMEGWTDTFGAATLMTLGVRDANDETAQSLLKFTEILGVKLPFAYDRLEEANQKAWESLTDLQIIILQDRDAARELGRTLDLTGSELEDYAENVVLGAIAEERRRDELEKTQQLLDETTDYWQRMWTASDPKYIEDREQQMTRLATAIDGYSDAVQDALDGTVFFKSGLDALSDALVDFMAAAAEAEAKAMPKLEDAWIKKNRALEDLDLKYQQRAEDAWIDYQRAIGETGADLAAYHAGTLQELLDLDKEYLQDREDAWTDYQQSLADIERDFLRDIEDANRDHEQRLADADADYARDRADALADLNQDLEDNRREHTQNLLDIDADYHQAQLELQEEYERRLYDIQNLAQQKLRDLQDKYAEEASDTRLKYLRRALESIEGGFYAESFQQTLRELFLGLREFGPGEIPFEFEEMYRKLLEDLRLLDEDRKWDEEDLSDDIDREQERRLEDLEEWLAAEQAALDKAHEERIAKEKERFAREQEERRRDYERKLEDLRIAHEREKAEIDLNHQRRLADIRLQAERERQEAALTYQRKLDDLAIEFDREKQLIKDKLEEQNEAARQKYNEALDDINLAKEREREAINTQYDRTKQDIIDDYEDTVRQAAEQFGLLPEALQPTYDQLEPQARTALRAVRNAIIEEMGAIPEEIRNLFLMRSPSKVMMGLAKDIISGLEIGGLNPNTVGDLIGNAFSAQAFQANIQAALPPGRAMVPGGNVANTISRDTNITLGLTAQYPYRSERSLRNDVAILTQQLRSIRMS